MFSYATKFMNWLWWGGGGGVVGVDTWYTILKRVIFLTNLLPGELSSER
jgi:hypothetical protein